MSEYIVESEFMHAGLHCVVILHSRGHRCGYVGVDETHPLYGKHYVDETLEINEYGEPIKIGEKFAVHGGITFSDGGAGSDYPVKSDLWWFGFDCSHYCDASDYGAALAAFANDSDVYDRLIENLRKHSYRTVAIIRTREYVEQQCKRLAEQISEYKPKEMNAETALKFFEGLLKGFVGSGTRAVYEFVCELLRKEIEND